MCLNGSNNGQIQSNIFTIPIVYQSQSLNAGVYFLNGGKTQINSNMFTGAQQGVQFNADGIWSYVGSQITANSNTFQNLFQAIEANDQTYHLSGNLTGTLSCDGNNFSYSYVAVECDYYNTCSLTRNTVNNCNWGLDQVTANYSTLSNNQIQSTTKYGIISLDNLQKTVISANKITNATGGYGIFLSSQYASVNSNTVECGPGFDSYGIYIQYSAYLNVSSNDIQSALVGIYVLGDINATYSKNSIKDCGQAGMYMNAPYNTSQSDIVTNNVLSNCGLGGGTNDAVMQLISNANVLTIKDNSYSAKSSSNFNYFIDASASVPQSYTFSGNSTTTLLPSLPPQ